MFRRYALIVLIKINTKYGIRFNAMAKEYKYEQKR